MSASGSHSTQRDLSWERLPDDAVYRHCRIELTGLLADNLDAADRVVPACPEWTVQEVIAHVVGGCIWAVRAREGLDASAPPDLDGIELYRLLDDWLPASGRLDSLLAGGADPMHPMMALDLFAHELDILHALGNPPPADHPAYPSALDSAVAGFSRELRVRELPSLRIESYGAHWVAGTGTPDVTLNADRHDLFRTLTGRRTKEQIASLSWDGAPDRWIPAFEWGLFIPPARPIEDVVGGR